MTKTRSITRNQYPGAAPWLDLTHDVLLLVMMQLGVIDFVAFSGVCKSWRSFALSYGPKFMTSKPPMFIRISPHGERNACYLIDFDERKFKTIIPRLVGRTCVGLTCGYLILSGSKEHDIWLVNPITRHELHFPNAPYYCAPYVQYLRAILVFSPSRSKWVFVLVNRYTSSIWFSIAGKGTWNHTLSTSVIWDLHALNGKIYILSSPWGMMHLSQLRLDPEPKLTLLNTMNFVPEIHELLDLVSSGENVYLIGYVSTDKDSYTVYELDFDKMKWVMCEKTREEYAFFYSDLQHRVAVKQELRADPCLQRGKYIHYGISGKGRFFTANMWYFPHDCLNVNRIDE